MEKKRMTKQEAIELLKNRKVYVNGKSAEIQRKLFELGWKWRDNSNKIYLNNASFLYIYSNMKITCGDDMRVYFGSSLKEISAEEILAIEVVTLFEENDVIVSGRGGDSGPKCEWVAVYDKFTQGGYYAKAVFFLIKDPLNSPDIIYDSMCNAHEWTRFATDDEKEKLIDALKKSSEKRARQILEEVFAIEDNPESDVIKDIDWNNRRYETAKEFMSAIMGRLNYDPLIAPMLYCSSSDKAENPYGNIASIAVHAADALIEELKKEK